jgi:hypothetical protein
MDDEIAFDLADMLMASPWDPDFRQLHHKLRGGYSAFKGRTPRILTYCYY